MKRANELDFESSGDNDDRKSSKSESSFGVRGTKPRELDQFFTKPEVAGQCVGILQSVLKGNISDFDMILEPSFGDGAFVNALKSVEVEPPKLKFVDIDARKAEHRANFLTDVVASKEYFHIKQVTAPPSRSGSLDSFGFLKKRAPEQPKPVQPVCLTIGNPPFGKNASLAISFFNRAAEFSGCIAFVVPRTFSKASVHSRLDLSFFLMHEHVLEQDGFLFKNEAYSVPCVFQVWVHANYAERFIKDEIRLAARVQISPGMLRSIPPKVSETPDFKFVKANSNPDLAIRRVGVNAGKMFDDDVGQRSEQSHFFIQIKDKRRKAIVIRQLKSLDLENTQSKFQTAGNPSISKTELCELYLGSLNDD